MSANDRNERLADSNEGELSQDELSQDELNNVSGGQYAMKRDPAGLTNAEGKNVANVGGDDDESDLKSSR